MAILIWAKFGFMGAFPRDNVVTAPSLQQSGATTLPATSYGRCLIRSDRRLRSRRQVIQIGTYGLFGEVFFPQARC